MVSVSSVNGVVETTQSYVFTIIIGFVILIIGFALGILAKKFIYRVLKEIELNQIMGKVGITYKLDGGISNLVSYLIYLITVVFFLNQLGITSIVLYLIVGGVLMMVILTFLVGMKDIIPNFVAWIMLNCKKSKIKEGYSIELREIYGTIERIGYLETEIKTPSGDILYVPNALFLKSKLKVKK